MSNYNPAVHPKLLLWIARCGIPDADLSAALEVPAAEFAQWKKEHPELQQAIDEGRRYWSELARDNLQKLMRGYDWTEEEISAGRCKRCGDSAQSVTKTKRHIPPDRAALIFFIRNQPAFRIAEEIGRDLPGGVDL